MKAFGQVSLCAIAVAFSAPAYAAETAAPDQAAEGATSSGGLEEIVVTARKRSENLQDVPVAVSAISQTALKAQGVFETTDLNHAMPNLQVSSPYGQQQPNFSLRGVGVGTEFNANAASPVGVYVDEVYQAFRASHGQQLYDLEQIEVVRGPQGTLYGRNTTGGAINFITHKPDLHGANGYLTLGYGSYNRMNMEAALEFTPVEDRVGVRIAGTYVHSEPYVRNLLKAGLNKSTLGLPDAAAYGNRSTGRDPGITESYGIRGTLVIKPVDDVTLTIKGYAAKASGNTETPIATGQSKTNDTIDYLSPNFLLGGLFGALSPAGLLPTSYSASGRGLSDLEVEADTVGEAISRAEGVTFTADFQLSDKLRLVSISGYDSGLYSQSSTDCDATPLRLCSIGYRSAFHAFNQDVRLDFQTGPLKLIVGGYYGKDSVTADNTPDFLNVLSDVNKALGLPASYFNPGGNFGGTLLPAGSLPTGIRGKQHFKQERTSIAAYGEGSLKLSDTLTATAGIRYTRDTNEFKDGITTFYDDAGTARLITVSDFPGGAYFLQPVSDAAGNVVLPAFGAGGLGIPAPGPLKKRGTSGRISGRFIIDWKPTEDSKVYASYSRGYRAGTFNGLAYGSAAQVYFVAPETVNAYEVGFKSRFFDNRVQLNGSAFYYDYKGQQGQVVDSTATAQLISLDGTMKGLELELQVAATDRLNLSAALGILDSSYKHGTCPVANIVTKPPQIGNCVASAAPGTTGGNADVGGNPFPYAAKSSINLGFDWTAVESDDLKLTLHGDANYTGRFFYDSFGDYSYSPTLKTVASGKFSSGEGNYWVLNARVTITKGPISLAGFVKNLTDKTYYPFGIAVENLFGNGYRVRAQPRMFGGELTARF